MIQIKFPPFGSKTVSPSVKLPFTFYACIIISNPPLEKALPVHRKRHGVLYQGLYNAQFAPDAERQVETADRESSA